jgi:charged multivesicular body protein 7
LTIRTGDELVQALLHPQHGKPTCLPAVFHDAVQKKEMVPLKEFMNSKESIYKTSWLPSPWKIVQWGLRQVGVIGQPKLADTLGAGSFVVLKNTEVAAEAIFKKMQEHVSNADRVLSRADFLKRFATILNPAAPLTPTDVDILLIHLARDRQAISYNAQAIKFRSVHESMPEAITQEDEAIVNLRDTLANINAQIPPLMEKIVLAEAAAREAVAAKHMVQAKAALRSKKLAETALAQRTDIAIQLEGVYAQLQQAADQVGIVEAMRAGADALKSLNEKVGGAEGVQGVVDAVNEQMTTTDEIANIIGEPSQPLDEMEIDDEFEALEKVEREKQDMIDAAKTAERLAQLEEAEQKQKDKEAQLAKEEAHRAREEMQRRKQLRKENVNTEDKVEEASFDLSKMSFYDASYEDENMEDAEDEKRVPVHV